MSSGFKILIDATQPKQEMKDLDISMKRVVSRWVKIRERIKAEIYNISTVVMSTISIVRSVVTMTGNTLPPIADALLTSIAATVSTVIGIKMALIAGSGGLLTGAAITFGALALAITLDTQIRVIQQMDEAQREINEMKGAIDAAQSLAIGLARFG